MIESIDKYNAQYEWLTKVSRILAIGTNIDDELNAVFHNSKTELQVKSPECLQFKFESHYRLKSEEKGYQDALEDIRLASTAITAIERRWKYIGMVFQSTQGRVASFKSGPSEIECKPFENELNHWKDYESGPRSSKDLQTFMNAISGDYSTKREELKQKRDAVKSIQDKILKLWDNFNEIYDNIRNKFDGTPDLTTVVLNLGQLREMADNMLTEISRLSVGMLRLIEALEAIFSIRKTLLEDLPRLMTNDP